MQESSFPLFSNSVTLGKVLPYINVRFIAIDGTRRDGGRLRAFVDSDDKRQRERLFRWDSWPVIGIHGSVRHFGGELWPTLIIMIEEPKT